MGYFLHDRGAADHYSGDCHSHSEHLPLPADVYKVTYIVALMPVSASSAVITRRYGGSAEFAGQSIIFTTVASLLTIPLMLLFMK